MIGWSGWVWGRANLDNGVNDARSRVWRGSIRDCYKCSLLKATLCVTCERCQKVHQSDGYGKRWIKHTINTFNKSSSRACWAKLQRHGEHIQMLALTREHFSTEKLYKSYTRINHRQAMIHNGRDKLGDNSHLRQGHGITKLRPAIPSAPSSPLILFERYLGSVGWGPWEQK